ncbi:MAG: sterol desaturase family protein [Pseudomonadota bacterium]|nr:sterol desaturase family protein [Pseudomonadota bacterium]
MDSSILGNEAPIRLGVFLGLLGLMALAETVRPRRARGEPRLRRWVPNLALVAIDTLALRVAFFFLPALAVGFAHVVTVEGIGLLPMLGVAGAPALVAGLLLFDLAVWAQHVASHKVPLLWRLHRVHHADLDVDVTTALRFHPVEIVLSMAWKLAFIAALGLPSLAVLLGELVLNGGAMFNHANLRLPGWLDRLLRLVIITPDVHRVHHSVRPEETDSNYGFGLTWWDRIFGTWRAQPADGHETMQLGLAPFRDGPGQGLGWMLALPFRSSR